MTKEAMYRELAKYYDYLYSDKGYAKESNRIISLINRYKKSKGKSLLDVGCGTGMHIGYLKKNFNCTGLDLNKEILDIARKKFKNIKFIQANMLNFNLNEQFDVITSFFSAIGYVKTYENLRKTISNLSKHLKKGGVMIIEPWFTPQSVSVGKPHMTTYNSPDLKIARVNVSKRRGNISILDFRYMIAEKNKEVKYYRDLHELGLFETDKTLEYLREAGLKPIFFKKSQSGRGLFVAVKK